MIVHILVAGRALCGEPGTPNQWPEGHWWVDTDHVQNATCQRCVAEFKSHRRK